MMSVQRVHLPECQFAGPYDDDTYGESCCCEALSALAQRLYADHVAALAERDRLFAETLKAIQRLHDDTMQTTVADVAVYGQEKRAEALRQAREVVAGLPWKVAVSFGPIDCDESCEHGPCTCSGVMRPEAWMTGPADALTAIDALKGMSE